MSWNNRVVVEPFTHKDGTVEHTASIVEVYYGEKVGGTGDITPSGSGFTERDAILDLKGSLELMLEAVNFVLNDETTVYNFNDVSTHNPGARSKIIRRQEFLDRDDDFMDERYGDNDDF